MASVQGDGVVPFSNLEVKHIQSSPPTSSQSHNSPNGSFWDLESHKEDTGLTENGRIQRLSQEYLKPNIGLVLLTVSYFFNSIMVVSTKVLETDQIKPEERRIKPLQILLVRMGITYIGTLIFMFCKRKTIEYVPFGRPEIRKWLILRGCVGFTGVFGMYFSLMYLTISDAVLITFLAPSITVLLAWAALHERFTKWEAIGSIVSLCGVILIVRPSFLFGEDDSTNSVAESSNSEDRLIATIVGLIGVLGASSVYIIIRYIGDRAHAIMSVSYFSLVTLIISFVGILLIPSMRFQIPESPKEWFLLLNLGLCGFIFQLLLTMGIQRERAGRGSLMSYTQLLYAVFWDVFLWGEWPSLWSWLGMLIIVGSTLYVARIKETSSLNGGSPPTVELQDYSTTTEPNESC